jgi:hypothetical protein
MKKTRLQKRGVMTVEEGRQAIDRMNVGGQAVQESLRRGSQGRSVQAKERRCGACGKMGHNARTFQIVVSVFEEEYSSWFQLI